MKANGILGIICSLGRKECRFVFVIFCLVFFTNCQTASQPMAPKEYSNIPETPTPTIAVKSQTDSTFLKESYQQEDLIVNEYQLEAMAPIRANYKRINSINTWESVEQKTLLGNAENTEARFYYSKEGLEKIIVQQFEETSQLLCEYYLLKGQLSFIVEKSIDYDQPAFADQDNSGELAAEQVEVMEDRSYFADGTLLHLLSNQDCGSPWAEDYLQAMEQGLKERFDLLLLLAKGK